MKTPTPSNLAVVVAPSKPKRLSLSVAACESNDWAGPLLSALDQPPETTKLPFLANLQSIRGGGDSKSRSLGGFLSGSPPDSSVPPMASWWARSSSATAVLDAEPPPACLASAKAVSLPPIDSFSPHFKVKFFRFCLDLTATFDSAKNLTVAVIPSELWRSPLFLGKQVYDAQNGTVSGMCRSASMPFELH